MNSRDISRLSELVKHVNSQPSKDRKLNYIASHSDETIKKFLFYVYSKNHSFGVSKEECLAYNGAIADFNEYDNIFEMFNSITAHEVDKSNAICGLLMGVANRLSDDDKSTFLDIIDKDLHLDLEPYELNVALELGYWDNWFIEEYDEMLFNETKYSHVNKYKELVA